MDFDKADWSLQNLIKGVRGLSNTDSGRMYIFYTIIFIVLIFILIYFLF